MKEQIYIETTIVSYLTARPSKDILQRGHQDLTRLWWQQRAGDFSLCTSQFVLDEAAAGDPAMAAARFKILKELEPLDISEKAITLADDLLADGTLPQKARVDALHLSIATTNGIPYLMTWNCRHLANAMLWRKIEKTCNAAGLEPSQICTPYELMGDTYDARSDH